MINSTHTNKAHSWKLVETPYGNQRFYRCSDCGSSTGGAGRSAIFPCPGKVCNHP